MEADTIALVAVEGVSFHYDQPFSYRIPPALDASISPGTLVAVPFGRGAKRRRGIILSRAAKEDSINQLRPIFAVLAIEPMVNAEGLALAAFLKERTFCTLFEALRLMMPPGSENRLVQIYSKAEDVPKSTIAMLTKEEQAVISLLGKHDFQAEKLCKQAGLSDMHVLEELAERGLILVREDVLTISHASEKMVRLVDEQRAQEILRDTKKLTKKRRAVVQYLLSEKEVSLHDVCYYVGVSRGVVQALKQLKMVEFFDRPIRYTPLRQRIESVKLPQLSAEQQKAYEGLLARYRAGASASLLYGVTGSGKTQVFMRLIEDVRADGRDVLVLVPEIALTPQTVMHFVARFGEDVAVLHSGLSARERLEEWRRIKEGVAHVVVGTRSAIFAPVSHLGAIILDEEQESTYKSESSPRYHARDVARFRCARNNASLVFSSATPSFETFFAAQNGRYALFRLTKRFGKEQMPHVLTVDMKEELANGNSGPLSSTLLEELRRNLGSHQQSILLLNRRGYNTFVSCPQCGHVFT
ncbi:MAG TPA: primosomal protein N', partial [Ruminococcaceae bacterium]|nr:primosomal protein N' [Oscillospiraceae bacterium]